jgi:MFS-type transporter involved in bile tolerance (Atg22 family)
LEEVLLMLASIPLLILASATTFAGEKDIDRISSYGYALGYLGGGILLAFNLAMILKPQWFGIPDAEWGTRYSFLTVGVWWTLFSIPILNRNHCCSRCH